MVIGIRPFLESCSERTQPWGRSRSGVEGPKSPAGRQDRARAARRPAAGCVAPAPRGHTTASTSSSGSAVVVEMGLSMRGVQAARPHAPLVPAPPPVPVAPAPADPGPGIDDGRPLRFQVGRGSESGAW